MAPGKREVVKTALGASILISGLYAFRQFGAKREGVAARLADGLIDSESLRTAVDDAANRPERALAACATYVVRVAKHAGEYLGVRGAEEDPAGYSRSASHPYTRASVTVLTESVEPDRILTYAASLPHIGDVRGTRTVGPVHMTGIVPARHTPDAMHITLEGGYGVQVETRFETSDYLLTGRGRVFGNATLRDSQGNIALINIGLDSGVAGTVTRGTQVVGRFGGNASHGIYFTPYQIPGGA